MFFRHELGWVFIAKLIEREIAAISNVESLIEELYWI